ncbi:TRAP transporter substrate-binding protein [Pelagibacterium limicola]|uniref:TRAP transporter substrate-binding protein n=1 Tax=Pelagibacterium limicola TaxID=2791022 RepID=UPI0018AFBC87|nr:TRAP transporter substrate-binding protein [Pelagibacterium limicola]
MKINTGKYLASTALVGALAFTATTANAQENVRWQVPMAFASTLTALGDTMPWVADQLRAMSNGAIDLQVAEPGTVIPALAIFENVSDGNIDAGFSWMGYEWGTVPAAALFGATPFGLESIEFMAWMHFHGGKELLAEVFHPYDVHPILCGTISPETAGWFREEITSVDDFQGIRFRAAGIGGEIMAEFGMSVTVMPGGELYQALETGVLDGTEFSLPTVDEQLGFYQVAPYLYLPGWHQPSTNQFLYVNLGVWEGLGDQTKAMIENACWAGTAYSIARAEALQGAVIQRFEESGTNVETYSDEIIAAFHEATKTVMERRSAADELFGRVYASMMEYQAELRPWKEKGYLPRDWQSRIGE